MKVKKIIISFVVILVSLVTVVSLSGVGYIFREKPSPQINSGIIPMEKYYLTTTDGKRIAVDLYPVSKPIGWVLLTHMMPKTKESWNSLASDLQKLSYESIAIDLRGHGESDGGPRGYQKFSDVEYQASINDLDAAVGYLLQRGATPDKIGLIGASIGANLSLEYISKHPDFKTAILLSTGLDYQGIKTEPMVKGLKRDQKVFFVSSKDDGSNTSENEMLYGAVPAGTAKEIKIYDSAGHGTNILGKQPDLEELIVQFLQ